MYEKQSPLDPIRALWGQLQWWWIQMNTHRQTHLKPHTVKCGISLCSTADDIIRIHKTQGKTQISHLMPWSLWDKSWLNGTSLIQ